MAKTILVVDDEPKNRELARDVLEVSGYKVIEAENGRISIEMAKSHKPDLILMDIMMPVMDGYTACHALRGNEDTKDIPIIMLTSVEYELNKKLAARLGSSEYVTKPFNFEELLDKISKCLPSP